MSLSGNSAPLLIQNVSVLNTMTKWPNIKLDKVHRGHTQVYITVKRYQFLLCTMHMVLSNMLTFHLMVAMSGNLKLTLGVTVSFLVRKLVLNVWCHFLFTQLWQCIHSEQGCSHQPRQREERRQHDKHGPVACWKLDGSEWTQWVVVLHNITQKWVAFIIWPWTKWQGQT